MEILLTPHQEQTLLSFSSMVFDESDYYYFPFFFKDKGGGLFERLTWDELPSHVKDNILKIRGIKLPVYENSTDGNPGLR